MVGNRQRGLGPRLSFWIAVSGGAGLVPFWPGTMGTLAGVGVAGALLSLDVAPKLLVLAGLTLLGIWSAAAAAARAGEDDPQWVVIDETVGAAITLSLIPAEPLWWLAGFLLFRLLDVVKPWPARLVHEHVHGGLGIVLDDVLAALMAAGTILAVEAALF